MKRSPMRRSTFFLVLALGATWTAATAAPWTGFPFKRATPAEAADFAARWPAAFSAVKQDRLASPRAAGEFVLSFDRASRMTIARKIPARGRIAPAPVRDVGPAQSKEKLESTEKLLPGCEPSFSPVTAPALAHIPGRCLS